MTKVTAPYRWRITKDHEDLGIVGVEGPHNLNPHLKSNPVRFSLWDDDGNCYCEGMLYSEQPISQATPDIVLAPLDDYGAPALGCTTIKINGEVQ